MINWQIRRGTANRKLGRGAYVVTLDRATCPDTCPLKGQGCYAESGPLALTWRRVSDGDAKHDGRGRWAGKGFKVLADTLESIQFPIGTLLRIGDAGDPSEDGLLSLALLGALGRLSARGVRVILYTHADMDRPHNARAVRLIRERYPRLIVNASVHGPDATRRTAASDVYERVTTVGPDFWAPSELNPAGPRIVQIPDGATIMRCPAEYRETDCERCGLCARRRGYAIGFTAHGSAKGRAAGVSL